MQSCKSYLYLAVFMLCTFPACAAYAQAVHPEVTLQHPTPFVVNSLSRLQVSPPAVALVFSEDEQLSETEVNRRRLAVRQWEYFLTGLGLPYEVIPRIGPRKKDIERFQVLIVPEALRLSNRELETLVAFVEDGGGLLASGPIGQVDERGRQRDGGFYASFFGADLVTSIPDTMSGLLQSLPGGHPPTDGLIPGFRLNIRTPRPLAFARVVARGRTQAIGRPYLYYPTEPNTPLASLTFLVYGTYGSGRFFWSLFPPQDVSREDEHQRHYQAMMINALAYVSGTPQVAVAPWPNNHLSATSFVVLPTPGAEPVNTASAFEHTLKALEAGAFPATFFILREQAPAAIRLLNNARADLVDLATAGDSYALFKGLPMLSQRNRLEQAIRWFRRATGRVPQGFHPPANLYDVATVWAMQDVDLRYLYAPSVQTRSAPSDLKWLDQVDWRETISPTRMAPEERILDFPLTGHDDYYVLQELGYANDPEQQVRFYQSEFDRIHQERGLYILPFHAENQARSEALAGVLTRLAQYARNQRSWVASLQEVHDWWRMRERAQLSTLTVQERYLDVRFRAIPETIEGVSLIYRPGKMPTRPRTQPQTHIQPIPDGYLIGLPPIGRTQQQIRIMH